MVVNYFVLDVLLQGGQGLWAQVVRVVRLPWRGDMVKSRELLIGGQ